MRKWISGGFSSTSSKAFSCFLLRFVNNFNSLEVSGFSLLSCVGADMDAGVEGMGLVGVCAFLDLGAELSKMPAGVFGIGLEFPPLPLAVAPPTPAGVAGPSLPPSPTGVQGAGLPPFNAGVCELAGNAALFGFDLRPLMDAGVAGADCGLAGVEGAAGVNGALIGSVPGVKGATPGVCGTTEPGSGAPLATAALAGGGAPRNVGVGGGADDSGTAGVRGPAMPAPPAAGVLGPGMP